jgi:2-polyprenyl-3-methyl-5-hydroxy-6-metoxy-1,4-benzoquinol methylase
VSWFRPHLEISLALIQRAAPERFESIIDIGGGASTLVDDLLALEYRNVTVLDISQAGLNVAKARLGAFARQVEWLELDVVKTVLPEHTYDVWHDRAVFHFLTHAEDRRAYVRNVSHAVRPGGAVIVATFGPKGPRRCSGLDVVRYDAASLHAEFSDEFQLVESLTEMHGSPSGAAQQFVYCYFRLEA